MPIRAISFDLFDTLVDLEMEKLPEFELRGARRRGTLPALYAALPASLRDRIDFETFGGALDHVDRELRATREAEGRELPTRERFTTLLEHLSTEISLLEAPSDALEDLALALTDVHMTAIRGRARALRDTPEILRALRKRFPLAVCSNFSHSETALRVIEEAGLTFAFEATVISEDVGFRKPHSQIFATTARALGVAPAEILHVGDNLTADISGATAAGMQTAWITRRVREPDTTLAAHIEAGGPPPRFALSDLHTLLEL